MGHEDAAEKDEGQLLGATFKMVFHRFSRRSTDIIAHAHGCRVELVRAQRVQLQRSAAPSGIDDRVVLACTIQRLKTAHSHCRVSVMYQRNFRVRLEDQVRAVVATFSSIVAVVFVGFCPAALLSHTGFKIARTLIVSDTGDTAQQSIGDVAAVFLHHMLANVQRANSRGEVEPIRGLRFQCLEGREERKHEGSKIITRCEFRDIIGLSCQF